jgi:hypothetical protein
VKEVCSETPTQTQTLPQTPSLNQTLTVSLASQADLIRQHEDDIFQLRATYVGKEVCNTSPNPNPNFNANANPHLDPS